MTYTLTRRELTTTPISPRLCGSFIELGYGFQAEGLRSEMLFNRSFEPFPPYAEATFDWFGLRLDPRDPSKGHKTDWTGEDWYHSAYEHCPWFAAPGWGHPIPIGLNSDYLIEESPTHRVRIESVTGDTVQGKRALRLVNAEAEWAGVAQEGKWLDAGQTYEFRGWLKAASGMPSAEVRFYPEGQWETPLAILPLGDCGPDWAQKTAHWDSGGFTGRATFCVWVEPGAEVLLDDLSLLPTDTADGWRIDAVEAIKQIKPGVIRFPGGCFASFHDWRDGVGPSAERHTRPSYFWGGQNANDVGTAEFAALARAVDAEMMLCVNLFHPKKAHYLDGYATPQFADEGAGIALACDWVAYCNLPAGTHPQADLRAAHGFSEPFGVRYWEMDNETARWFGPEEYADTCARYARAMKAVDPAVQIGMMVYDDAYRAALPQMLEIAGADINFLADRGGDEARMEASLVPMRAYNAAHGTRIGYTDTEWLADDFRSELFWSDPAVPRTYWFNKWRYALNIFSCVMAWQRRGGEVLFFNFNGLANTHGQCALETPHEGVFLTAAGLALELLSHSPAAWPLALEGYTTDEYADVQVQAAWDLARERLVLYVFNASDTAHEAPFDLSVLGRNFTHADVSLICGDGPRALLTADDRHAVRRTDRTETLEPGAVYTLSAPPYSFLQAVLFHG